MVGVVEAAEDGSDDELVASIHSTDERSVPESEDVDTAKGSLTGHRARSRLHWAGRLPRKPVD